MNSQSNQTKSLLLKLIVSLRALYVCPSQIDDLSREVGKLKDALNSLSQLSYTSGSPSKRLQQNQQLETLQQQIKQLQYQLSVRFVHHVF